ncbi:ATP12 family chaperone protein [Oceaniglobus indicus]|uniref:ATP12 family chaperone protein n=1 Tax=Oceaniglobus indicus TaxID=2047749 RepID=UPI000C17D388|nr:ATP12 family protein [Oceaniglobus indicus]
MADWATKRFWSEVSIEETAGGFGLRLDGRGVKTPARADVVVPTRALADMMADEWRAQSDTVDPATMPVTRSVNAALDKVAPQRGAVEEMIIAYAETDLLCYRATSPAELIARQNDLWDPLLAWAADGLGAPLKTTPGVMPVEQPPASVAILRRAMAPMSVFEIAAFHDLVGLSGSFILGLAVSEGRIAGKEAWDLSRLDEEWQVSLWGRDDEADATSALKRAGFLHAERVLFAARPPG